MSSPTANSASTVSERPSFGHLPAPSAMDAAGLQSLLDTLFAAWVQQLGLKVEEPLEDGVRLSLPVSPHIVHGGGVLCGQAMMAAADTAMVLAASKVLGGFKPITTVQMQTSFLRAVPAKVSQMQIQAHVLKSGRQLLFGQVNLELPDGQLAAQATCTCALIG